MARSQFHDTAIDSLGNAVTTTQVSVYLKGTNTLATVYTNESGGTLKGNPFICNTGYIDFWMEPGPYDVLIADTAIPAAYTSKTVRFDSIPGVDGVINQTLADQIVGASEISTLPQCKVFFTSDISLSNDTSTDISFNSEVFDTDSMHSNSVNNNRITFNTAGLYLMVADIRFAINATNYRQVSINYYDDVFGFQSTIGMQSQPAHTTTQNKLNLSTIYKVGVGDYVTVLAYQNSGGALNITSDGSATDYGSTFTVVWLSH